MLRHAYSVDAAGDLLRALENGKAATRRTAVYCALPLMSAAEITSPLRSRESELAERFWHFMSMMREVEDRIERKLYRQGKIVGGGYVARGQEALPVGPPRAAQLP